MLKEAGWDEVRGGRLRRFREHAGLTLRDFGAVANIDHTMISRVERGLQKPSQRLLRAYADHFGLVIEPSGWALPPQTVTLDIALALAGDERACASVTLRWCGTTGDNYFAPSLYLAGEDLDEPPWELHSPYDSVKRPEDDCGTRVGWRVGGKRAGRVTYLVGTEEAWLYGPFEQFEEVWTAAPRTPAQDGFTFLVPRYIMVQQCNLKILVEEVGTDARVSWNGEPLIGISTRFTSRPLGPLGGERWYSLAWQIDGSESDRDPFWRSDAYECWYELERRGWVRVGHDRWVDKRGNQKTVEQLKALH